MSFDIKKFKEDIGGGGLFLKTSDCEEGRRLGIVPWIIYDEVGGFFAYYGGWHVVREKNEKSKKVEEKSRPIRFTQDQHDNNDFPDDIEWAMSSFAGQKPKPQIPKPCFALIVKDYETRSIKVIEFTQATIVKSLVEYLDKDSKFYEPNIINKDILISKVDDRNWKVELRDKIDENWSDEALMNFHWDWHLYLQCEDATNTDITFSDVLDRIGGSKNKQPVKKSNSKKKKEEKEDNYDGSNEGIGFDWREITTPQKKRLGDCSLEDLKNFKSLLEKKFKPEQLKGQDLYEAIKIGISELEVEETEDISF